MTDENFKPELGPIENKKPKIVNPSNFAAGAPAVRHALQNASHFMTTSDMTRSLLRINQQTGFDCPGCAWPDPAKPSKLGEYCENGVKALAEEATTLRANPDFFNRHSILELSMWSDYKLGKSGRITHPMYLSKDATHYSPISWRDAFETIATSLNGLTHPNEAIFYTSGRTSNEAAFLYQLFVRHFGTNNLPDCSNMCHESTGVALSTTIGIGKGTVTLDDFNHADLIVIIGQNPGTNHPRMLTALEEAKKNNNAKIISINPLKEVGLIKFKNPQKLSGWVGSATTITDLYLQLNVGSDLALLQAIGHLLDKEDQVSPNPIFDHQFIKEKTSGFESWNKHIRNINLTHLVQQSGVSISEIKQAVDLLASSKKTIFCWAMGVTQQPDGVNIIKEIVNITLAKGSIGKKGSGLCPVRGHSNVQGDRTVGIHEKLPKHLNEGIQKNWGFTPPQKHGYNAVQAAQAMHQGKAKFFMGLGGNYLSAMSDTSYIAKGLTQCELTVHISTKLNRSHLIHGKEALILPCLSRSEKDKTGRVEQFVTIENSMGQVHTSKGHRQPASDQLKSEVDIICHLAQSTLGPLSKVEWLKFPQDYDTIRDAIEATIPGFEQYNQRVRNPLGFYLPNGPRLGNFTTSSKKAIFSISKTKEKKPSPQRFIMMTLRSHDQYNTTIYNLNDRYRGIQGGRRVIFINPEDMKALNIGEHELISIKSHYKKKTRQADSFMAVPYDIPKGCVASYFPEANVLVPIESYAQQSMTPTSKHIVVSLHKK